MSLCSQLLELLPTETWESISNFVVNSRNMKSSDSKTPMRRQKQITEKVYLTWNLWGPGRDNSNYCLVIWSKKDMLPSPQRSPKVSSNHHRKKFLVCNRLPGLHSWPGTIKPLASRKGTKANHTSHIQGDLQVCGSSFFPLGIELGSGCILACLLPQGTYVSKEDPECWLILFAQS